MYEFNISSAYIIEKGEKGTIIVKGIREELKVTERSNCKTWKEEIREWHSMYGFWL